MAWFTIRNATLDDRLRVQKAAEAFCERHGIDSPVKGNSIGALYTYFHDLAYEDRRKARHLSRLWFKCVERATGAKGAQGIDKGRLGYNVDLFRSTKAREA